MEKLKQYFKNLIRQNTYRGWHLVQAEKTTHKSITDALLGIKKLSNKRGFFAATDENLKKLNKEMSRKGSRGSALSIRKQVLVNLDTFGFIKRFDKGQKMKVQLTKKAQEYLDYENKEFFMDDFLSNFKMKKDRMTYSIVPYPILLKMLSDNKIQQLTFKEFQYFVSEIKNEGDIQGVIDLILEYRQLVRAQKNELHEFIKKECDKITSEAEANKLPKEYKRDYENWTNNAKHSLEFFNLGSQIKFYDNEIHLLLGSDEFKKKIIADLKKIQETPIDRKQKVYFRDKKIMDNLKKLYGYHCQFCGYNFSRIPTKKGFYIEASHIIPVSEQSKYKDIDLNSPKNIVITCPNHHKMIDVYYPEFKKRIIVFEDGKKGLETTDGSVRLFLTLNEHL
ncbi:AlwI family type II restriction endonuclease [Patescibacteria group bacterium]|nr:AlwI family type II restriction endonuclease [Patescibacteria group bacterium]